VIFNDAMPLMARTWWSRRTWSAASWSASVYAVGMLRGRTDRYHRSGLIIAFTVAAIATPVQMGVGDGLARWVYDNQPTKFAAIEMVPTTEQRRAEVLLGHLNSEGEVVGGHPHPGSRLVPVRPQHRDVHRRPRAWTRHPRTNGRRSTRSTWCTWPGT
jgi:cytochrome d ubiquinol oxidase subunit I